MRKRYWGKLGVALTAAFCIVLSGSFIVKGETIDNELVRAENLGFLNYQVSSAILTSKENEAIANGNINETIDKINQLVSQYPYQDKTNQGSAIKAKYFGEAKGSNLIVLQLESFQNFPINASLDGQVLTPVLNDLAKESYYFSHFSNRSVREILRMPSLCPIRPSIQPGLFRCQPDIATASCQVCRSCFATKVTSRRLFTSMT